MLKIYDDEKFHDTGFNKDFFDMTPKAQATTKLGKLDCIRIKNCTSKDEINRLKWRVVI